MKSKEELQKIFKHFDMYEIESSLDETTALRLKYFDDFLHFTQKHKIDSIFYHYSYASTEDFIVDNSEIYQLDISETTIAIFENKIHTYNNMIETLDFSRPYLLTIYVILEGFIYFVEEEDYWFFNEYKLDIPKDFLMKLKNQHFKEIIGNEKNMSDERLAARELLKAQIIADEAFHKCTNAALRREYEYQLFQNNAQAKALFYHDRGYLYDIPPKTFIEKAWKEYKGSLV